MNKIFPNTKYVIIALLSLVPGLIIHWYFTYGDGKQNLQQLIDQYGSISDIPLSKAILYDFHFTWLTYTLPCLLLVGFYWMYKYGQFKSTGNKIFEPTPKIFESKAENRDKEDNSSAAPKSQFVPFKGEKKDDNASPIKPKDGAGIR